jgi:hypothetical protein
MTHYISTFTELLETQQLSKQTVTLWQSIWYSENMTALTGKNTARYSSITHATKHITDHRLYKQSTHNDLYNLTSILRWQIYIYKTYLHTCMDYAKWSFQNACSFRSSIHNLNNIFLGHLVMKLVEALCYKLVGCGCDSQWRHWNFSFIWSLWWHYGAEVNSASNRNEY